MEKQLPKVFHFTNIAALYRTSLWARLIKNENVDYHFIFGTNKNNGIKTIDTNQSPFKENRDKILDTKNVWIKKKYLFWQTNIISKCLFSNAKMVILLDEFNVLSNWIAALICRIRNIHLVFRGHGMYGNEKGLKLFLRKSYFKLANEHLVYERRAKKVMISHGFKADKIHIIFNSLNYETHCEQRKKTILNNKKEIYPFFKHPDRPTLLFVGRLTKIKKLKLLLEAKKTLEDENIDCNLLIVGDGSERDYLKDFASKNLKLGTFHFYGSCYDDEINAALISCADVCVSPGNVGLTAIHCLSLGTPVITHDNHFNQMPESEAITPGKTGLLFNEDNSENLAQIIEKWLAFSKNSRNEIRTNCYRIIDQYYNPRYQEQVILNLLQKKPPMV